MVKKAVNEYLNTSSIHGFPDFASAASTVMKFLWGAVIIAAIVYCGFEITKTIIHFSEDPMTTRIDVKAIDLLPEVTVCQLMTDKDFDMTKFQQLCPDDDLHQNDIMNWVLAVTHAVGQLEIKQTNGDDTRGLVNFKDAQCSETQMEPPARTLEELLSKYIEDGDSPLNDLNKPCIKKLLASVKAQTFSKILTDRTTIKQLDGNELDSADADTEANIKGVLVGYEQEPGFYSFSEHPPTIFSDADGGMCQIFNLTQSFYTYGRTTLRMEFKKYENVSLKILFDTGILTNYYVFQDVKVSYGYAIHLTMTKKARYCIEKTRSEMREEATRCFNQALYDTVKCCVCGAYSQFCPSDAVCCIKPHICEATKQPSFMEETSKCTTAFENQGPPCQDKEYVKTMYHALPRSDMKDGNLYIYMNFVNQASVLVIEEVPLMTRTGLLGSIGGVLGLFMGGSIMSAVQLLFFCLSKIGCQRKPSHHSPSDLSTY